MPVDLENRTNKIEEIRQQTTRTRNFTEGSVSIYDDCTDLFWENRVNFKYHHEAL